LQVVLGFSEPALTINAAAEWQAAVLGC